MLLDEMSLPDPKLTETGSGIVEQEGMRLVRAFKLKEHHCRTAQAHSKLVEMRKGKKGKWLLNDSGKGRQDCKERRRVCRTQKCKQMSEGVQKQDRNKVDQDQEDRQPRSVSKKVRRSKQEEAFNISEVEKTNRDWSQSIR